MQHTGLQVRAVARALVVCSGLLLAGCSSTSSTTTESGPLPTCPGPGTPGIELCVTFEQWTSASVVDESGKGRNGLLQGGAVSSAEGRVGKGARFGGREADTIDFGLIPGLTDRITVQAWVRATRLDHWETVVDSWYSFQGFWIGGGREGGFEWWVDEVSVHADVPAAAGSWHHLAGTFDRVTGAALLYVDGRLVASDTTTHAGRPIATSSNRVQLGIGGMEFSPFDGVIDEVQIWSVVRSQAQICVDAGGASAPSGDCTAR